MVKFNPRNALITAGLAMAGRTAKRYMGAGSRKTRSALKPRTLTRLGARRLQQYRKKKNNLKKRSPIPGIGGAPSMSRFQLARRPAPSVRAMKKVTSPCYFVTNQATQLKVGEGFQGYADWSFNSISDLNIMSTKLPPNVVPPGVEPWKQFVLESAVGEFLITNSTLATMYVDVYDVVRKRDATSVSSTTSPSTAWNAGVYYQSQGSYGDAQIINTLPTDSRNFNDYFKVIKRTHLGLSQGATHRHSVILKPNFLADTALLNSMNGDIAGVTVYTLIVAYGQPVSVTAEGSTAVSTASGNLDIVKGVRYKFSWVQNNTNNYYAVDNLNTLIGLEEIVSQGAGAIVPNASV